MAMVNDRNKQTVFVDILKQHLEQQVKDTLTNDITNDLIEEFKKKIEPEIKEMVEHVSFEKIELLRNHLDLDEHLKIYLKWRDHPDT